MRHIFRLTASTFVVCLLLACAARGQATDAPKTEVAVLFSTITLTPSQGHRSEVGFGGRVAYNVTDRFGIEAELSLFPNSGRSAEGRATGRGVEGLFGAKFGQALGEVRRLRQGATGLDQLQPGQAGARRGLKLARLRRLPREPRHALRLRRGRRPRAHDG